MIMQSKQISCSYSRLNTRLLSSSRWVVTLTESSPVGSALIDGRKRHDTIGIIFSKVSPSARKWFILLKIDLGVSFPSSSTFVVYSFTFTLSQNSLMSVIPPRSMLNHTLTLSGFLILLFFEYTYIQTWDLLVICYRCSTYNEKNHRQKFLLKGRP